MRKLLCGVSTVALMSVAQVARAQDTSAASTTASEVIVTGTRQTGVRAEDSAQPIQVVGQQALQHTGQPDLTQSLQQNVPSFNVQQYGADSAALTVQAALRGLSPNDTLVLVNGKRRHDTANLSVDSGSPYSGSASVDLSLIPVGAIDHVEVLQDGAAAQYGSDAVAGVVNVILKDRRSWGRHLGHGRPILRGRRGHGRLLYQQGNQPERQGLLQHHRRGEVPQFQPPGRRGPSPIQPQRNYPAQRGGNNRCGLPGRRQFAQHQ